MIADLRSVAEKLRRKYARTHGLDLSDVLIEYLPNGEAIVRGPIDSLPEWTTGVIDPQRR